MERMVRIKCDDLQCLNNKDGECIADYILIDKKDKCQGDYITQ